MEILKTVETLEFETFIEKDRIRRRTDFRLTNRGPLGVICKLAQRFHGIFRTYIFSIEAVAHTKTLSFHIGTFANFKITDSRFSAMIQNYIFQKFNRNLLKTNTQDLDL